MFVPTSTRDQHQSEKYDVGASWLPGNLPSPQQGSFCSLKAQITGSSQSTVGQYPRLPPYSSGPSCYQNRQLGPATM